MKNELENLRLQINEIDLALAKLFAQRMDVVKKVAIYKKENNLPVFDETRENQILANAKSRVDEHLVNYYLEFVQDVMKISKDYQNDQLKK
jgi:monofunctional chorismate mutase